MEQKHLSIWLPVTLHADAKRVAEAQDRSVTWIIKAALERYLAEAKPKN